MTTHVPKIIVAGGRNFDDRAMLYEALHRLPNILWSELVNGMCPTGADKIAREYARERGRKVHEFPADWDAHGKKAGPIRNAEMAEFGDILIAFWDGKSAGTRDMIFKALKARLEVHVYLYTPKKLNEIPVKVRGL